MTHSNIKNYIHDIKLPIDTYKKWQEHLADEFSDSIYWEAVMDKINEDEEFANRLFVEYITFQYVKYDMNRGTEKFVYNSGFEEIGRTMEEAELEQD